MSSFISSQSALFFCIEVASGSLPFAMIWRFRSLSNSFASCASISFSICSGVVFAALVSSSCAFRYSNLSFCSCSDGVSGTPLASLACMSAYFSLSSAKRSSATVDLLSIALPVLGSIPFSAATFAPRAISPTLAPGMFALAMSRRSASLIPSPRSARRSRSVIVPTARV